MIHRHSVFCRRGNQGYLHPLSGPALSQILAMGQNKHGASGASRERVGKISSVGGFAGNEKFHLLVDPGGPLVTAGNMDGVVAGVFSKRVPGYKLVMAISQGHAGIVLGGGGAQKVQVFQKVSEPSRWWGKVSVGRA